MAETINLINYPRRRVIRSVLRQLIRAAFAVIADFVTIGAENFPKEGPLLVIGNHFSFLDPVAVIGAVPYPIEYMGGAQMPNAPGAVSWIARVYGVLPVYRGSVSRQALHASKGVLNQNGVLGIFPEAGSWATVLRPARPGAAYLASCTKAKILPIGLDGLVNVFPFLRQGKRARVTIRIGKPFGPLYVSDQGENDKAKLADIGEQMMHKIAQLIPYEGRGRYSEDAILRAHAELVSAYPWDGNPEQ
jgi:1-acyl-sn-glycerol-3-phosphate acyltransferase